jgi:hypothetical protein
MMKDKFYNMMKETPMTAGSLVDYIKHQNYSDTELNFIIDCLINNWAIDKKSYRLARVISFTAEKLEDIQEELEEMKIS